MAKQLSGAVAKGLGGISFGSGDYKNSLKAYLDQNIFAFSGAKSLVMLKEYNRLLLDDKGEILPFNEFKARALAIDALYNKTYLSAEYENAVASAQMAEKWEGLKGFPLLEYRTVGDSRVRPEHAILDGLILESRDQIWNRIYPPNAWHCRCTVVPAAGNATPTNRDTVKAYEKQANILPYFKRNVGKQKTIFANDHPYIKNLKNGKISEWDAEKNYGMPSVEKIYAQATKMPAIDYAPDKQTALDWWTEKARDKRGAFDLPGADGLTVTFDNNFRNHVLEQNADNRWKILSKTQDVLKNPDEIWTRRKGDSVSVTYIKYYDKAPIVLQVTAGDKVRADTIYEATHGGKLNTPELIKVRKGQLKFKK